MKRLAIFVATFSLICLPAFGGDIGLFGEGVGMYTDSSVANQASAFNINRTRVSCAVGTVLVPGGSAGPFEMIMYSLSIDGYLVEKNVPRTISATGLMRSITRIGGVIVEDTDGTIGNPPPHDYIAIAYDKDSPQKDHFDIHFKTGFWNTGNPMCSPSNVVSGGCRFGGDLFFGNINASNSQQF